MGLISTSQHFLRVLCHNWSNGTLRFFFLTSLVQKRISTNCSNHLLNHFLLFLQQQILSDFDFIRFDILKNTVSYASELRAASSHLQKYDEGVDMFDVRQPSTSIRLCRPELTQYLLTFRPPKTVTNHKDNLHAAKDDLTSTSSFAPVSQWQLIHILPHLPGNTVVKSL